MTLCSRFTCTGTQATTLTACNRDPDAAGGKAELQKIRGQQEQLNTRSACLPVLGFFQKPGVPSRARIVSFQVLVDTDRRGLPLQLILASSPFSLLPPSRLFF